MVSSFVSEEEGPAGPGDGLRSDGRSWEAMGSGWPGSVPGAGGEEGQTPQPSSKLESSICKW